MYSFDRLTFVDGVSVALPASGVVLVVGPNNAGKSTMLAELQSFVLQGHSTNGLRPNQVVQGATTRIVELRGHWGVAQALRSARD